MFDRLAARGGTQVYWDMTRHMVMYNCTDLYAAWVEE